MASSQAVIEAWHSGKKCGLKRDSLTTDGNRLLSYALVIGYWDVEGNPTAIVWNPPRHPGSTVTAAHVTLARRYGINAVEAPQGHQRGCSSWCAHLVELPLSRWKEEWNLHKQDTEAYLASHS